jgi:hypothetical protein
MNPQSVLTGFAFEPHEKYTEEARTPTSSPNKPRASESPKPSPGKGQPILSEAVNKAVHIVQNASLLGSGDAEKTAKLYFGAGLSK